MRAENPNYHLQSLASYMPVFLVELDIMQASRLGKLSDLSCSAKLQKRLAVFLEPKPLLPLVAPDLL